jgi:hypothetical protein
LCFATGRFMVCLAGLEFLEEARGLRAGACNSSRTHAAGSYLGGRLPGDAATAPRRGRRLCSAHAQEAVAFGDVGGTASAFVMRGGNGIESCGRFMKRARNFVLARSFVKPETSCSLARMLVTHRGVAFDPDWAPPRRKKPCYTQEVSLDSREQEMTWKESTVDVKYRCDIESDSGTLSRYANIKLLHKDPIGQSRRTICTALFRNPTH